MGIAVTLTSLLLVSGAAPAFAQSSGWSVFATFAPTLQPGENQLFTVVTAFNGTFNSPANVNATIITPDGGAVNLNGFVAVSTGYTQTLYNIPDQLGTYSFTIFVWNSTVVVETFGSFSAVSNDAGALASLSASSNANSQALANIQGNITANNKATQSSLAGLGSDINTGTNTVEGSLASLGSSVSSQISASQGSLASSISALSSQVSSGNSNLQSTLSGISSQLTTISNTASNAETYALGALVVALLAVLVAAYGAMKKR